MNLKEVLGIEKEDIERFADIFDMNIEKWEEVLEKDKRLLKVVVLLPWLNSMDFKVPEQYTIVVLSMLMNTRNVKEVIDSIVEGDYEIGKKILLLYEVGRIIKVGSEQ